MKANQFHDFKTVKEKVRFLLQTNPALRDDDMRLIATYYFHEIGKEEIEKISAYELLTKMSFKQGLTNFETIRRWRTKLQYYEEDLRGSQYKTKRSKEKASFRVCKRD